MNFAAGTRVRRASGSEEGVVLGAHGDYVDVAFSSGSATVHMDDVLPADASAAEMLSSGEVGDAEVYCLRLQQMFLDHAYRYDPRSGLSNARIEPAPHQIFVAHRVVQKVAPRMILADEVGLGKTIEAGLVLKELRARRSVERVLIVTPASLLVQWQHELSSKFNESFTIIDGDAAKYLGRGGENPFTKHDNVLCSLPFAANPKRAEQIVEAGWDLAIFDEAHRVRRTRRGGDSQTTQAYRLADDLKDDVNGLLLLTATPVQLHAYELYSLIELVEPGLLRSPEHFDRMRRRLPELNELMRGLHAWPELSDTDRNALVEKHESLLTEVKANGSVDDEASRLMMMDGLTALHPLAQVMVRNRKSELGIVSERIAHRPRVELSDDAAALYTEVSEYIRDRYNVAVREKNRAVGFVMVTYQRMLTSSSHALRTSLKRRAERLRQDLSGKKRKGPSSSELDVLADDEEASAALDMLDTQSLDHALVLDEIALIEELAAKLAGLRDGKTDTLLDMLATIFADEPNEKVVIFTQFIETQTYLAYALRGNGYRVALFNGQLKPDAKEAQIQHFRRDAQILISTEAGGEGRNLQFCHILVNYDLPWNPMKVEQRIGRLDRIGQKRAVIIYNLAYEGTIEDRVLGLLQDRIKLFEESIGALDPILGEVEKDIQRMVLADIESSSDDLDAYSQDIETRVRQARASERMMSDFILDRASLRSDQVGALLDRAEMARPEDLATFMKRSLSYLGGTLTDHQDGGHVVSLSPNLASRMKVKNRVVRGAFPPALALNLEDIDFFAFGNEMADRLIEHAGALTGGNTGCRITKSVPPGVWIELVYRISSAGPRPKGFLIRHLVGEDGNVRAEQLETWDFADKPTRLEVPIWTAAAVEQSAQRFRSEFAERRPVLMQGLEDARQEERARVQRLHDARRAQLEAEVQRAQEWLDARSHNASDRDRKIMPARQGRLTKDLERLHRLDAELDTDLNEINSRRAEIDGRLISAGLARGLS